MTPLTADEQSRLDRLRAGLRQLRFPLVFIGGALLCYGVVWEAITAWSLRGSWLFGSLDRAIAVSTIVLGLFDAGLGTGLLVAGVGAFRTDPRQLVRTSLLLRWFWWLLPIRLAAAVNWWFLVALVMVQ